MGRKPNKLVIEFFSRGPKLEDASNRYEHTCKACGERFPKGRIDSLTTHVFKKCPAITVRERQRALLEFNELPSTVQGEREGSVGKGLGRGKTIELPVGNPSLARLEALAEVSRHARVGFGGVDENQSTNDPPRANSPHSLALLNSGPNSEAARLRSALSLTAQSATEVMMSADDTPVTEPSLELRIAESLSPFTTTIPKATQTWPLAPRDPSIDPAIYADSNNEFSEAIQGANPPRAATFPRAIAINPDGGSSPGGTTSRERKQKLRGKFTSERRKEVQAVRKIGACLRCRMLRKPCSNETPCSTCSNVESARLWKNTCVRTKLAAQVDIFSSGLWTSLAERYSDATTTSFTASPDIWTLHATQFPTSSAAGIIITSPLTHFTLTSSSLPLVLAPHFPSSLFPSQTPALSLHSINYPYPQTSPLKSYLDASLPILLPSATPPISTALSTLLSLLPTTPNLLPPLHLWTAITILTTPSLPFTLTLQPPTGPPLSAPPASSILLQAHLQSHLSILLPALSQITLSTLETRLLRRNPPSNLGTFLTALITISSLEKLANAVSTFPELEDEDSEALRVKKRFLVDQAERFVALVVELCGMRGVLADEGVREWGAGVEGQGEMGWCAGLMGGGSVGVS
ncbi:MAG: hypothetical protein M1814_004344 [Vezdaea aestivalis]|nr:MAG: hypothetical protein M1814_004344 [Vezdaea aestivalis]